MLTFFGFLEVASHHNSVALHITETLVLHFYGSAYMSLFSVKSHLLPNGATAKESPRAYVNRFTIGSPSEGFAQRPNDEIM